MSARMLFELGALLEEPDLPLDVATSLGLPERPKRARVARELEDAMSRASSDGARA